ncbi:MAG: GreA/GreB family elongation factor [Pseudomonadota bacterium]
MSRAFVKNDVPDEEILVPPRAPLPPGTINYVTPRGLALLKSELAGLGRERAHAQAEISDAAERQRQLVALTARISELNERIISAQVVDSHPHPRQGVRFGATVTLHTLSGKNAGEQRRFTLVGVDEAMASEGRIAFTAPIARIILGKQVGDTATLHTAEGEKILEITAIDYAG